VTANNTIEYILCKLSGRVAPDNFSVSSDIHRLPFSSVVMSTKVAQR
jgi:hypothetical protein